MLHAASQTGTALMKIILKQYLQSLEQSMRSSALPACVSMKHDWNAAALGDMLTDVLLLTLDINMHAQHTCI